VESARPFHSNRVWLRRVEDNTGVV